MEQFGMGHRNLWKFKITSHLQIYSQVVAIRKLTYNNVKSTGSSAMLYAYYDILLR